MPLHESLPGSSSPTAQSVRKLCGTSYLAFAIAIGLQIAVVSTTATRRSFGDEPPAKESFEDVLSGVDFSNPMELVDRIRASEFCFSSAPGDRHGYFQHTMTQRPESEEAVRDLNFPMLDFRLDDDGRRRIALLPSNQQAAAMILSGKHWFRLNGTQWEFGDQPRWSWQVDGETFMTPLAPAQDTSDRTESGFIRLAPESMLDRIIATEKATANWHPDSQTLTARKTNGTFVAVCFRTPNDQQVFGTLLREFYLTVSGGQEVILHTFFVDRDSRLRIHICEEDQLAKKLNALRSTSPFDLANRPIIDAEEEIESAAQISKELVLHKDYFDLVLIGPQDAMAMTDYFGICVREYKAMKTLDKEKHENTEKLAGFAERLVPIFEAAVVSIERLATEQSEYDFVDDPHVMALGLDRAIGMAGSLLASHICRQIIAREDVPVSNRLSLVAAVSELGPRTPSIYWLERMVSTNVRPADDTVALMRAVIRARWNWLPTDVDREICLRQIKSDSGPECMQMAAIDSLVRWGLIDDISQDTRLKWLDHVIQGSTAFRHCAWKALTKTHSGRTFVYSQWNAFLAEHPLEREQIRHMLRQRAKATRELHRFDFMTRKECDQIASLE